MRIRAVRGMEILDSRGQPTVGARVELESGVAVFARVPAGASTGVHEAVELRDQDRRYGGRGVQHAVANIDTILGPAIAGRDARNQAEIDQVLREIDGHPQKARLGANAILAVSLGVAQAAAAGLGLPLYRYLGGLAGGVLPVPFLNVVNGGAHADNNIDIQEFMLVPGGADSMAEAMRMAAETYAALKALLHERGLRTAVGDEGGFAPDLASDREALDLLMAAIERAGYRPGEQVALAVDVAASGLYREGRYRVAGRERTASELIDWYEELADAYPLVSLEDGLAEDDWEGWQELTRRLGGRLQLVGDDLFVTSPERIRRGVAEAAANAVLIKLNQVGTVTETLEAVRLAQRAGWRAMISHRSGETEDTSIADLAVGLATGQMKSGAPARGERVAKYNRLLWIEATDADCRYAGWEGLR
ncbi:MAG: phosphopyruvate hydratase [Firmicutes bacterium]|nr:phosphopyruvate hydratase [Bacillota bacterium]